MSVYILPAAITEALADPPEIFWSHPIPSEAEEYLTRGQTWVEGSLRSMEPELARIALDAIQWAQKGTCSGSESERSFLTKKLIDGLGSADARFAFFAKPSSRAGNDPEAVRLYLLSGDHSILARLGNDI